MYFSETLPIQSRDRLTACENALTGIEPAVFGGTSASTTSVDVAPVALAAPLNLVITQTGTAGTTNYSYVIADVGNVGLAPCTAVQTTTGNATLASTGATPAANVATWSTIPGHTYNVYRSASSGTPSGTGFIGTATAGAGVYSLSLTDAGITATLNVPTTNTSGCFATTAPFFSSSLVTRGANIPTVATSGNATYTVAQMANLILVRNNNATAISDTTPTAAALVAAYPGCKANSGFWFSIRNACTGSGTLTMVGGTGVTLATGNTNTIAISHSKLCFCQFTTVTLGSEAVTIFTIADSAF